MLRPAILLAALSVSFSCVLAAGDVTPAAAPDTDSAQSTPAPKLLPQQADMSLVDAVQHALQNHPQSRKGERAVAAAEADVAQARSGYYPSLDLRLAGGMERSYTEAIERAGEKWRELRRNENVLTLRQMLFDGFEVSSRVDKQQALVRRALHAHDDQRQALALRTAEAYFEVLRTQEQIAIEEENVAEHQRILDKVQNRMEQKLGSDADVSQVKGRLALAQAQLEHAQAIADGVKARFAETVGLPPGRLVAPPDLGNSIPDSLAVAQAVINAEHPAVQASQETLAASSAAIDEARARYYPRLDLELTANESENLSGNNANEDHYSAMLVLSYNIYRGGGDRAKILSTLMTREMQDQERMELIRILERDLALVWHAREGKMIELRYFTEHLIATDKAVQAYSTQYELGQRTLFDLLNARSEYFRAKSTVVDTKYALVLGSYQILANMGTLLTHLAPPAAEAKDEAKAP